MNPRKSHPGHRRPRYTRQDIQDSNRLRNLALRMHWQPQDIATAAGCSVDNIRKWMAEQHILSPLYTAGIKRRWPAETAQ